MLLHLTHPVASRNGLLMPCTQQHGHLSPMPGQCLQRLAPAAKTQDRQCNRHSRVNARAGEEPGPLDALKAAVSCRTSSASSMRAALYCEAMGMLTCAV